MNLPTRRAMLTLLMAAGLPAPTWAAGYRTIGWDDLLPPDWNPAAGFKGVDVARLTDGDPRAAQLLKRMREIWDSAPANPRQAGAAVRVPGYVVPLEQTPAGMSEFLLVPHFGACIHTPPPPANQIIHARLKTPLRSLSSMDTVWISGALKLQRADTTMGVSSYAMDAVRVEPYTAPR
jgi:hypothetical protein